MLLSIPGLSIIRFCVMSVKRQVVLELLEKHYAFMGDLSALSLA